MLRRARLLEANAFSQRRAPLGPSDANDQYFLLKSLTYEYDVNRYPVNCAALGASLLMTLMLTACGTPAAKDFGGRWKPVNHFDEKTTEIPLAVPYTFYASPMDGTLKTMLTRWTTDTGMKLSYRLRSDFTLYKAASQIHTSEARDAASELSTIYAPQGVAVTVDGPEIIVQEISAITAPAPSPATPAGAAASPQPAKPDSSATQVAAGTSPDAK